MNIFRCLVLVLKNCFVTIMHTFFVYVINEWPVLRVLSFPLPCELMNETQCVITPICSRALIEEGSLYGAAHFDICALQLHVARAINIESASHNLPCKTRTPRNSPSSKCVPLNIFILKKKSSLNFLIFSCIKKTTLCRRKYTSGISAGGM